MQRRTCNDRTFAAIDWVVNGPRPCIAFQIDISAIDKRDALKPPEPKRTAAHSKSGRGRYISAGIALGDAGCQPNTKELTATIPHPSIPASRYRARLALRIQEAPLEPQTTMLGTSVSSASVFVKNRVDPISQYPLPQPVPTTTPASKNDVTKGARTTPKIKKRRTPRVLSNTDFPLLYRVMSKAPSNASPVLLMSQPTAVHAGTPDCIWANRWAGNTASRSAHHIRAGERRSAPSKIALGGQKVEVGREMGVRAKPTRVPM
jgi:hypothetical protein